MATTPKFVKTSRAARVLGIAPNTARRWADAGVLPISYTSPGGQRFISADALNEFAKSGLTRTRTTDSKPK